MNNILWHVKEVDPNSPKLIDRTGTRTVATTDPINHIVNIAKTLKGDFYNTVLIHELGHCTLVSFDLLNYIHERVPKEYWVDIEELICNIIADYGLKIFSIAKKINEDKALETVPIEIGKYVEKYIT